MIKTSMFRPTIFVFSFLILVVLMGYSSSATTSTFKGHIDYKKIYTGKKVYSDISNELKRLHNENKDFTEISSAGLSVDSRDIFVFKIGKGTRKVIIDAGLHSREYITSLLTLKQIEYIIDAYKNNLTVSGQSVRKLLDEVSIWFIPMANPDGVELSIRGRWAVQDKALLKDVPKKKSFTSVKVNLRGVNLNRNYDVEWGKSRENPKKPFGSFYPGKIAFSEPETRAFRDLCLENNFEAYITYHASGEIIYWYYDQKGTDLTRDLKTGNLLSKLTGYKLISKSQSINNRAKGGGSREWFVHTFKKPGFTLEVGKGAYSGIIDFKTFESIWNKNKNIPLELAKSVK